MDTYTALFINRKSLLLRFWFEDVEMQGYQSIEVWRSILDSGGPYAELTGDTWGPAIYQVSTGSKKLVGKVLKLLVGVTPLEIVFSGTDPLSPGQMADQITGGSLGLVQAVAGMGAGNDSYLRLQTTNVGVGARLAVVGGDAAYIIGFSTFLPTSMHYGTDARPRLRQTNAYDFEDPWGRAGYYYKTRLRRDSDGAVSEFSVPVNGNATRVVTPDKLVRGVVRIVDLQGRPVGNRSIMVSTKDTIHNSIVDGMVVDADDQVLLTDSSGYASLLLLRGVKVAVGIAGTALVRDIVPPTDPTVDTFNLFDPNVGTDDAFKVMVPEINLAEPVTCP